MRTLVVALALTLATSSAHAALTTENCLAKKRQAQGKLQQCRATEDAKALQNKKSDRAKCDSKFQETLAALTAKATKAGVACRFRANGDGTVTDYDTGLQWEQKDAAGGGANLTNPHDVDNLYSWSGTGTAPDGSVFRSFLSRLNNCSTGALLNNAGFAFHCDWRLPTLAELQTILLAPPPCTGFNPCIDPIFGPTGSDHYWSSLSDTDHPEDAWSENFGVPTLGPGSGTKTLQTRARAVRGGL